MIETILFFLLANDTTRHGVNALTINGRVYKLYETKNFEFDPRFDNVTQTMLNSEIMNAKEVDKDGTPVSQDCGSIVQAMSQGVKPPELPDEDPQVAFDHNCMT